VFSPLVVHYSVVADKAEYLSIIQVSQNFQQLDRGGLYFDHNDFKANRQVCFTKSPKIIFYYKEITFKQNQMTEIFHIHGIAVHNLTYFH